MDLKESVGMNLGELEWLDVCVSLNKFRG